jgi:hypothetical protein
MSTARLLYKEKKPSILSRPSIKAGIEMICLHRSTQIVQEAKKKFSQSKSPPYFSSSDWLMKGRRKIVYYLFHKTKFEEYKKKFEMVMFSNNSLMNAGKNPFLLFRCGKDQLVRRNNKLFFFFSFSQNNKQIKT